MNTKKMIAHNKKMLKQIAHINEVISFLQQKLEQPNIDFDYELQNALETLVSSRDELQDCMYMYDKGNGDLEYYGL
jgi:hypothetical protein